MGKLYTAAVFAGLLIGRMAMAQTAPFMAVWSFEGNSNGVSNHINVGTGGPGFVGVSPNNLYPYVSGQSGQAVNVANWSQSVSCNFAEYIQVNVSPLNGQTFSLSQFSVFINQSSSSSPQEVHIRSSIDNFGSDLASSAISTSFQKINISLSGAGFTNQAGTISFRIYACNGKGGTIRVDELTINGTVSTIVLPITLLSFTAKPDNDRVQLVWTTASEYNADRFVIERSSDLGEFIRVGEVTAKGTTNERHNYSLIDSNPLPGINYYRLKQVDFDGTIYVYKPISAIIQLSEPVISVFPNPANPDRIHLRLWNADGATVRLVTRTGQAIAGRLEYQSGEADFIVEQPLSAGLYWLDIQTNNQRKVIQVMVR